MRIECDGKLIHWSKISSNVLVKPHKKPEGAKWFLPFLPPGGIDGMSVAIIEIYWVEIMHVVVGNATNKGKAFLLKISEK